MKKIFSLVLLFFLSFCSCQNLDWFYYLTQASSVYQGNFQNSNRVYSIAIDKDENTYMVGTYQENLGFDPASPATLQLNSTNTSYSNEFYLVKVDKNKKYLWHKTISIGINSTIESSSIVIDKHDNVIIGGAVRGNNINLNPSDPSSTIYTTDSQVNLGLFIVKYDKNGNFSYGNFYHGGMGSPKLAIDSKNNLIVTGNYWSYNGFNTDFDLSNQDYYITAENGWYENYGFILKNDEFGKFLWVKYIAGWNSVEMTSLKVDNSDNILFLSNNESYYSFNGEKKVFTNEPTGSDDFLSKLDNNGNLLWVQNFGIGFSFSLYDSQPFDIDIDNSIVFSTISYKKLVFPNETIQINDPLARSVIFKLNSQGNYQWHSYLKKDDTSQSINPISVFISADRTINWSNKISGRYKFNNPDGSIEELTGGYSYAGTYSDFTTLLKLNLNGKLIYDKSKIMNHTIARRDKNDKMYFAGQGSPINANPDFKIDGSVSYPSSVKPGAYVQKLDKCYSGTPDGDPYFYTCISTNKKIKDLYPKTSYSSWYDSPTSLTPLSPETVLETKKYYASTQDVSCPSNPKRLEVDVRVYQNPPKLIVPDFTFCNLSGRTLYDLKINNNKDIDFFDENLQPIYGGTIVQSNKKYYVRQYKSYSYFATCWSDLTEFYVYNTSTPPLAVASQTFCKIDNKKISDITVSATNPKWYDAIGNVISNSTPLIDNTKYYVTQNSSGCESAKTEILVKLSDPNPPTGNATQTFCSASNPTLKNIVITGTDVKWYNNLGTQIPETTLLQDGSTYFASQKISSCESTSKLAVKVNVLANYLAANDYNHPAFCNDSTSNIKTENLDKYKKELITNPQDYTFQITDSKGQTINGDANLTIGQNIFDVKITSGLGCFQSVKLSLTLNEKPKINLPAELEFCNNAGVPLNAGYGTGYIYEWNTGETSQIINADKEQTYTVKVTTKQGCQNTASVFVKKAKLAEIQNILINNSNNASVIMSFADDYVYSLDKINWQSSNKFDNLKNGNYTVYVKTNLGCDLGSKSFTIFSFSNIFSPNSDGVNDTWKISGIEHYPNSQIRIIDKNGRMVLDITTKGEAFEWKGEYNGRKLPSDNYWYQIRLSDGRVLEGYVVIKNR